MKAFADFGVSSLRKRAALAKRVLQGPQVDLEGVIIGVGAQKSGTSWLAGALARHDDVYMRRKEVHYWDVVRYPYKGWDTMERSACNIQGKMNPFGSDPLDHSRYLPSLDYGRVSERFVSEITPSYAMCTVSTYKAMSQVHHNVKFVFLMRDPVQRLWSGIRHKMREVLKDNPGYTGLEDAFLDACENPYDPDLRRSKYDETIRNLKSAGCIYKPMFFETLFEAEALSELAAFLNVGELEGRGDKVVNAGAAYTAVLSEQAKARARQVLAPTYEFIFDMFGDSVPAAWKAA
jgi:hypothetical protein|nr:sulfotransferase [Pseudooceanicola nitratireducens]